MSEQLQALTRTVTPVLVGLATGILAFLLFSYVPLNVLVLGLVLGVAGYVLHMVYQMNLDSVRRERAQEQVRSDS